MTLTVQVGLTVLTGLIFLVRLVCVMVQAYDDKQIIQERSPRTRL
ncbi:hypothetical protein [Lentzea sp. NPDC004782]